MWMWLLGAAGLFYFVSDFLYTNGFARRARNVEDKELDEFLKNVKTSLPEAEKRVIRAVDNIKLTGYFYFGKRRDYIVILLHGYGMCHKDMLAFADKYYNELGYSIFLPDLRCHGESEGKCIGFGWQDRLDVLRWIDYIRDMLGDKVNIILHGVSMGGATALMTGEENPDNVRCVISDCAYTSIEDILVYRMKKQFRLPAFPFIQILNVAVRIRGKYSIYDGNIVERIDKCKIPILYIHGADDDFVPPGWVYSLYSNTKSPKELYICDGAEHAKSAIVDPEAYFKRITGFLAKVNL